MLPDNFQAQLLNPAFYNKNDKITLAIPGAAGFSFMNNSNVRPSDVLIPREGGGYLLRYSEFEKTGNKSDIAGQTLSVPLLYVSIPIVDGALSFYWNEYAQTGISLPKSIYHWIINDNLRPEYNNFNSENIGLNATWNHEFGMGIAGRASSKINVGGRLKVIFNDAYLELNNWNYSAQTTESGDEVVLMSSGRGYIAGPFVYYEDREGLVRDVKMQEGVFKNLYKFKNPGLALDLGFSYDINDYSRFDLSINNIGVVWFRRNSLNLYQDKILVFKGMDFSNSLDPDAEDYVHPQDIMFGTKRDFQHVFRPSVDTTHFVRPIDPRTYLHYQRNVTETFTVGLTNQTFFRSSFTWNTFSVSGLWSLSNLSLIGNVSLHNISSISLGGGFQWNTPYLQLFMLTDNIGTFYHPGHRKSFSLTAGLNFLLPSANKLDLTNFLRINRKQKNEYLPFYR